MKSHLWIASGLRSTLAVVACGPSEGVGPTTPPSPVTAKSAAAINGAPCAIQTEVLLQPGASAMPANMAPASPAAMTQGGPLVAFPGYRGTSDEYLGWQRLRSGPGQSMMAAAAIAQGHALEAPNEIVLPVGGPLYQTYPGQVFQVAESVVDFGTVSNAETWYANQRKANVANSDPTYGNGIETLPSVSPMGDDTFIYQIEKYGSPAGDIYTDIQVRAGAISYAVSIDAGSGVDGSTVATGLVKELLAAEQAACA